MRYTAVRGPRQATLAPRCRDGYDNDSNGMVDYPEDGGCSSADDPTEWTCHLIGGRCLPKPVPWWMYCVRIGDSTVCLSLLPLIIGAIIIVVARRAWRRRAPA